MDLVTQAALGGVMGELVLGRKIGWKGMAWGLLFGTLPDLDIIAYPWLDEVQRLRWHRGISHSLLMIFLTALIFAKPLAWLHREKGVSAKRASWFIFLAWGTHVLIDVFTSYGTQIFEPFSDRRVAFSNLFIIDLLFTLPLLIVLVRALFMEAESAERRKVVSIGLGVSCLYVFFSFVMKIWAMDQVKNRAAEEIPGGELVAMSPSPLNTLLWRGLIETDKGYWVTYWSPFDKDPGAYQFFAKQHELAKPFEGQRFFEDGLKWFSRGHWVARDAGEGKIMIIDMRFGALPHVESKQLMPMFQWRMGYDDEGKLQAASYSPKDRNFRPAMGLIWERIWGNQTRWQQMKTF